MNFLKIAFLILIGTSCQNAYSASSEFEDAPILPWNDARDIPAIEGLLDSVLGTKEVYTKHGHAIPFDDNVVVGLHGNALPILIKMPPAIFEHSKSFSSTIEISPSGKEIFFSVTNAPDEEFEATKICFAFATAHYSYIFKTDEDGAKGIIEVKLTLPRTLTNSNAPWLTQKVITSSYNGQETDYLSCIVRQGENKPIAPVLPTREWNAADEALLLETIKGEIPPLVSIHSLEDKTIIIAQVDKIYGQQPSCLLKITPNGLTTNLTIISPQKEEGLSLRGATGDSLTARGTTASGTAFTYKLENNSADKKTCLDLLVGLPHVLYNFNVKKWAGRIVLLSNSTGSYQFMVAVLEHKDSPDEIVL